MRLFVKTFAGQQIAQAIAFGIGRLIVIDPSLAGDNRDAIGST